MILKGKYGKIDEPSLSEPWLKWKQLVIPCPTGSQIINTLGSPGKKYLQMDLNPNCKAYNIRTKPDGRESCGLVPLTQEEVEAEEAKPATHKHVPYIFMQVLSPYKPRAKAQSQNTLLDSDYCFTNTRSLNTTTAQTQRTRPCLRTPPRTLAIRGGVLALWKLQGGSCCVPRHLNTKGERKNVTGFVNL